MEHLRTAFSYAGFLFTMIVGIITQHDVLFSVALGSGVLAGLDRLHSMYIRQKKFDVELKDKAKENPPPKDDEGL